MSRSDIPPSLLDRYLTGECSAEQAAHVRQWLEAKPDGGSDFEFLNEVRTIAAQSPAWDVQGMWRRTQHDIADRDARADHDPVPAVAHAGGRSLDDQRRLRSPVFRTAAAIACAAVFGALFLIVGWQGGWSRAKAGLAGNMSTYATGRGERASITLPDGSMVSLSVASRLRVPADYGAGNRTVTLDGEAMFNVSSRAGSPFTVVAGPSRTRVLGTRFFVRHYATDSVATITVREGKVSVGSAVLSANTQVRVGMHAMSAVHAAAAEQFSFTTGILTLGDVTLEAAIPDLNRWYNADIRLGSASLATRGVKGEFAAGSLSDLTTILQLMFDVRIVRTGRTLTLYPTAK